VSRLTQYRGGRGRGSQVEALSDRNNLESSENIAVSSFA
jgi:hypothetical protein